MMHYGKNILALAALLAIGTAPAAAESRGRVTVRAPGNFHTIGNTAASTVFRSYSTGLGALRGPSPGPGGDLLRSSIAERSKFTISRARGGAPAPNTGMPSLPAPKATPSGSARTGIPRSVTTALPALSRTARPLRTDRIALAVAAYVDQIESTTDLTRGDEPITSLVPETDSAFGRYMKQGETAFRAGSFQEALNAFQLARDLSSRTPESLISLVHASFATSKHSYKQAGFYLTEALQYLPELPLANIRPKGFYSEPARYAEQITRLEKHLDENPNDPDALLLLAYFRWFQEEPDTEKVRQCLAWARRQAVAGEDSRLIETVDTFWAGAVASGRLTAEPEEPAEGKPTSRPANPESAADVQSGEDALAARVPVL
mgnify:FL=1